MFNLLKDVKKSVVQQDSLASTSMRDKFNEWLDAGNTKKYPVRLPVARMDKISEYAVRKKISSSNLWEYTNYNAFKTVYNKLLNAKLLRITDRKTYKVFIVVGQLYMRFLQEEASTDKKVVTSVTGEHEIQSDGTPKLASNSIIDAEDVISWLVTQQNANGTLYLENVVRQYMRALHTVPVKFEISNLDIGDRSVLTCLTPKDLIAYWNILKGAPNYKQVNSITSGMFSAGMSCYLRYLEYLENDSYQKIAPIRETRNSKQVDDNHQTSFLNSAGIDMEVSAAINIVLAKKFTNGFRYSNGIELSRLRRLVKEQLGKEVILNDTPIC